MTPHFPVKVLDGAALSWEQLARKIREERPTVVGLSCWTIERRQTFKTARLVKEVAPEATIIIGGHHATAFPEQMFSLG